MQLPRPFGLAEDLSVLRFAVNPKRAFGRLEQDLPRRRLRGIKYTASLLERYHASTIEGHKAAIDVLCDSVRRREDFLREEAINLRLG
jgi:hypothetical protein